MNGSPRQSTRGWPRRRFLTAWICWVGAFAVLLAQTGRYNSMHDPGPALVAGAALGGVVALAVTGFVSVAENRPVIAIDLFRIACWTLAGVAMGVRGAIPSPGYFRFINGFYPSYMLIVERAASAVMICAFCAIATAGVFFPRPVRAAPNHCRTCGYDLTGNTSGVCPECGERT